MQWRWIRAGGLGIAAVALSVIAVAQSGPAKPTLTRVAFLHPESPAHFAGNCTASTSGYLEADGRRQPTEAEIGRHVMEALREGNIITIYPATERGIFEIADCRSKRVTEEPSRP